MPLPLRSSGLALAAVLALTGCSGGGAEDQEPASNETSASPTAAESPYLEVPEGVELTAQGTELEIGDRATVAYEPRQGAVAALEIRVTRVERASFDLFEGWDLNKETRQTTPYFVRATVGNVGQGDLGEQDVPLYIVDGQNRLIEASAFEGTFRPCDGGVFPEKFRNGDTHKTCLVYLAPDKGRLTAVSFRPTQDFDPITWTGDLARAGDSEPGGGGEKNGGDKSGGDDNGGDKNGGGGQGGPDRNSARDGDNGDGDNR